MFSSTSIDTMSEITTSTKIPANVVLLTSYVPPHQAAGYEAWTKRIERLTILVSTEMEKHRNWHIDWGSLDVKVQRSLTLQRPWKHKAGFSEDVSIHFPVDTYRQLKKLKPDLIISGELGLRSLLCARYCKRNPHVPLVLWACVSEHTEQGRGWLRDKLRRWLVKQADTIIVNGASGRRYIAGLGYPNDRIHEIPYSCPTESFRKCPLERDDVTAKRLIFVGQLIERKGLHLFLPALATWAEANPTQKVEMTIVGSGRLEQHLREIPMPQNVQLDFAGWKPYDQLGHEYAKAGMLVFPTLADEWGLVVNEAMAAGLPVLGSTFSASVEELCEDGKTGWPFRPDRPEEIHNAINDALSTPLDDLQRMRAECRERIASITSESCADALADVLRIQLERKSQ